MNGFNRSESNSLNNINRRNFLGRAVTGTATALGIGSGLLGNWSPRSGAGQGAGFWTQATAAGVENADPLKPDTLFLTWRTDPTTSMAVQWIGADAEPNQAAVSFAPLDGGASQSLVPIKRDYPLGNFKLFRSELTGLTPGTEYQFHIGDGKSAHRFRTMPAKATDSFSFISGGDCGVNPHVVANNAIAAKQDPMFALIGGDLAYDDGKSLDINMQFMRNYSQEMLDSQGRLIPMVVCIGNHEVNGGYNKPRSAAPFFFALYDGLYSERSYATLDFGDYLSLVLLDTEHNSPIAGEQTDWLDKTLSQRRDHPHLFVCNHVPAYPSFRPVDSKDKKEATGEGNRQHWVPLFDKYNVDIVLEHHDHTFKRTHPLKDGHV
ncbi:MAG TPA: metallophosphoesterase family protein, partial [Pirellulales bacterium]